MASKRYLRGFRPPQPAGTNKHISSSETDSLFNQKGGTQKHHFSKWKPLNPGTPAPMKKMVGSGPGSFKIPGFLRWCEKRFRNCPQYEGFAE